MSWQHVRLVEEQNKVDMKLPAKQTLKLVIFVSDVSDLVKEKQTMINIQQTLKRYKKCKQ